MRRLLKLLLALALLAATPFGLAYVLNDQPAAETRLDPSCSGEPRTLNNGDTLTLMSWNIQYSASRKYHFFYDGGPTTRPEQPDVDATLQAISRVIADQGPDVLLIQEIDRDSARTGRVDQLPALVKAANAPCAVTAQYHRSKFVPSPMPDFLGRVDMHVGFISRFTLQNALRIQLPLLKESWFRQQFNLKRALLTAEIPIEGLDKPLALANTHLSAFSFGDGSMEEQVRVLMQWMESRDSDQPWILVGDMNLLPPGDDPKRLGADAAYYADSRNPVELLLPKFKEIFGENQLDPSVRTYLPFGAASPDRKIDYVFYGGPITVIDARVIGEASALSDHLPILFTVRVGDAPEQEARVRPQRKKAGVIEGDGLLSPELVERRNRERPLRRDKDPNTDSRADTGSPGHPTD